MLARASDRRPSHPDSRRRLKALWTGRGQSRQPPSGGTLGTYAMENICEFLKLYDAIHSRNRCKPDLPFKANTGDHACSDTVDDQRQRAPSLMRGRFPVMTL